MQTNQQFHIVSFTKTQGRYRSSQVNLWLQTRIHLFYPALLRFKRNIYYKMIFLVEGWFCDQIPPRPSSFQRVCILLFIVIYRNKQVRQIINCSDMTAYHVSNGLRSHRPPWLTHKSWNPNWSDKSFVILIWDKITTDFRVELSYRLINKTQKYLNPKQDKLQLHCDVLFGFRTVVTWLGFFLFFCLLKITDDKPKEGCIFLDLVKTSKLNIKSCTFEKYAAI